MVAQFSAPASWPAKSAFFRFSAIGRIVRSTLLRACCHRRPRNARQILSCHVRIVLSGQGRRSAKKRAGRIDFELRARVVIWPPLRLSRLRCERVSVDVAQPAHSPINNMEDLECGRSEWMCIEVLRRSRFLTRARSAKNSGGTGLRRCGGLWAEASTAPLPKAERDLLARHLDELDWLKGKLEKLDGSMARIALDDSRTRKLMTIAGINSVVATAVIAAIGDISRFPTPDRLASYFGLTPRVRQSGDRGAIHGCISKQGNAIARTMLIEAAWSVASVPGPLRAFFLRIKDRKGLNVAAVATARKIANLIWQLLTKEAPYRWARPAFVAMKMRKLELRAGAAKAHGAVGPARDFWIKKIRHREMELVAQAEAAYAAKVVAWRDRPAKPQKS